MTEINLSWTWVVALIIQGVIQAVAYGIVMFLVNRNLTKMIKAIERRRKCNGNGKRR